MVPTPGVGVRALELFLRFCVFGSKGDRDIELERERERERDTAFRKAFGFYEIGSSIWGNCTAFCAYFVSILSVL